MSNFTATAWQEQVIFWWDDDDDDDNYEVASTSYGSGAKNYPRRGGSRGFRKM